LPDVEEAVDQLDAVRSLSAMTENARTGALESACRPERVTVDDGTTLPA
jgi:hypothetical protein